VNQIEQALIDGCAKKCATEIHKTLKLFKTVKYADKILLLSQINSSIQDQIKDLENERL
jgi:hypothetical protein